MTSPPELIRWRGFLFEKYGSVGLWVLFFSIGYLGVNLDEARSATVYQGARPVQKHDDKHPVYVTGKLVTGDLGSPFVKPGRYLRVEQSSEVYAWGERIVKGQVDRVDLEWTSEPKDPKTFRMGKDRPLLAKKLALEPVFATEARIEQDGKKYAPSWPDVELPYTMIPRAPAPDQLAASAFKFSQRFNDEALALYESEACMTAPTAGCQRVLVGVVAAPEVMTVIGRLEGERLVKFDGTLKGAGGDLEALNSAYAVAAGMTSLGSKVQRTFCVAGIWLSLAALQRPLRRILVPLAARRTSELSGLATLLIAGAAWLLHSWALLLAFATVGALLYASREPATS